MKNSLLLSLLKGSIKELSNLDPTANPILDMYLLRNLTPKVIIQKAVKKNVTTIVEYLEFPHSILKFSYSAQLYISDLSCLSSVFRLLLEDGFLFFIPAQL